MYKYSRVNRKCSSIFYGDKNLNNPRLEKDEKKKMKMNRKKKKISIDYFFLFLHICQTKLYPNNNGM